MEESTTAKANSWWYVVSRWLEYEGEMRAALIRVCLVAAFYSVQLVHYLLYSDRTDSQQSFQRQCTLLACVGLFISLAVLVAIARQWLPAALKYVTVAFDILLVTAVTALGSGSESPMVLVYTLVIALAGLRGSLPLVWFASIASMLGYLAVVGLRDEQWFDEVHETPVVEQLVVFVTLAATGVVIGQLLRMHRQVTLEMKARQDASTERDQ